jgi:hypothetical protein
MDEHMMKVARDSQIYYNACIKAEQTKDQPEYRAATKQFLDNMIGPLRYEQILNLLLFQITQYLYWTN